MALASVVGWFIGWLCIFASLAPQLAETDPHPPTINA